MKPIARLLNNEKGMWFKGIATDGIVCEGEDALIFPAKEPHTAAARSWLEDVAKLVSDGYAEYL